MGLIAKENGGGNYDPIPAGLHQAVCVAVIDLGTHFSEKFGKRSQKVLIQWEIPEERILIDRDGLKQDLPRSISKQYTLSLSQKANLRKDLEAWRGRPFTSEELQGFDMKNLIEANCYLNIIHNKVSDKTYANIASLAPLRAGKDAKVKPESPPRFFSFDGDGGDDLQGLPEWIMEIIKKSDEYQGRTGHPDDVPPEGDYPFPAEGNEDVPF